MGRRKKGELAEETFFLFEVLSDGNTKLVRPPTTYFDIISRDLRMMVDLGRKAEIHSTWLECDMKKNWVVGTLYSRYPLR